jgi:hypothetical protein
MKKEYAINIENPCQKVQWAKMTETMSGKFCSLCASNVVDFEKLTDAEIIKLVESYKGKICGRLTPQQMNRLMTIQERRTAFKYHKILAGLLILGTTESSFALTNTLVKPEIVAVSNDRRSEDKRSFSNGLNKTDSLKTTISGKLIDYEDNAVIHESVKIKGTKISAQTDSLGNFTIELPENLIADTIVLVTRGHGWEGDLETMLFKKDLPITNLVIKKENPIVGEITYKVKRKWWQFWKTKFY